MLQHPAHYPPALNPRAARLSVAAHTLAVLWLGLMAGFFGTYSANVNLAMLQMDGATYAMVQSAFNRNVRHPLFFACFFGPPAWCALALALGWSQRRTAWWRALAVAGVAYVLGIIFFTQQVNLPLNQTTESWDPQAVPPDWASVRDRWNAANLWRAWLSLATFGVGLGTLVWRFAARPGERRQAS